MVNCGEWNLQIKNGKVVIQVAITVLSGVSNLSGGVIYSPKDKDIVLLNNGIQFIHKGLKHELMFENYVPKRSTQTIAELQKMNLIGEVEPSILCFVYDLIAQYRLSKEEVLVDKPEVNIKALLNQYQGYRESLEKVNWEYVLQLIEVR